MKLKTVRVRRSRPSTLALALALMLTMLCVYLVSLHSDQPAQTNAASAQVQTGIEVRMDGMEAVFDCDGRYDSLLEARVAAAHCVQSGGAGLILAEEGQYAVVRSAGKTPGENSFSRSAAGITLKLSGRSDEITAVSDAAAFLHAQAAETGSLADTIDAGNADTDAFTALLSIYQTQGRRAQQALNAIDPGSPVVQKLSTAVEGALSRLDAASACPDAGKIRLIHAAACAEWISLINDFAAMAT